MATKRLSDKDGVLKKFTVGAEITGDGTTAIPSDGYYLVTAVAGSSELLGTPVGYTVYLTTSIIPAVGDDVKPLTFEDMCFVQNASVEFSKDELESTTLCDTQKVYEVGFTDVTGSFDGVAIAGSSAFREVQNKFMATSVQDGSTNTVTEANDDIYYLFLETYAGDQANAIPEQAYMMPVQITTSSAGVSQGSMQTFSSSFRVTSDGVNGLKPVMIERTL